MNPNHDECIQAASSAFLAAAPRRSEVLPERENWPAIARRTERALAMYLRKMSEDGSEAAAILLRENFPESLQ